MACKAARMAVLSAVETFPGSNINHVRAIIRWWTLETLREALDDLVVSRNIERLLVRVSDDCISMGYYPKQMRAGDETDARPSVR